MEVNFKELKQIVDNVILTEAECMQVIQSLLAKENEVLRNAVLEKIISVLGKWSSTPPVETLKELEEFREQNKLT